MTKKEKTQNIINIAKSAVRDANVLDILHATIEIRRNRLRDRLSDMDPTTAEFVSAESLYMEMAMVLKRLHRCGEMGEAAEKAIKTFISTGEKE